MRFAVTESDTIAYLSEGSSDQLTLRRADETTMLYLLTLFCLGESERIPEP